MHKTIKKLGAILLALTMLFALNATAFATPVETGADTSTDSTEPGTISNAGVVQGTYDPTNKTYAGIDPTIRFDKEIIIFNTRSEDTLVYLPNVKFNYTIAPASITAGTPTITDENYDDLKTTAKVKAGVAAAVTGGTTKYIEYSNTAGITNSDATITSQTYVITNANGAPAAGYVDFTFNPAAFGSAGIYRYVITEAEDTTLTLAKAGVTQESTYATTRYLDVYVHNIDAAPYLEIYGFVLFESDNVNESFDAETNANLPLAKKTNGFVSDKNDGSTAAYDQAETGVDKYFTSNVKIQKKVDGALGDKNNEFPFAATISNTTIISTPKISFQVINDSATLNTASTTNPSKTMTVSGGVASATIGAAAASVADGFKLDDQDYIYIYGIPGKTNASTVISSEFNNTVDIYTVSAKYDNTAVNLDDNDETDAASVSLASANVAGLHAAQTIDITKTEDVIEVTNLLSEISPTGVVLRIAPYALMLGAGFIFLAISKRRKEENEA